MSMADGGSGYLRGSGYGMKMTTWLRGKGPGAHGEADDRLSWLGDDRKATNPSMESGGRARGRRLVAAMWGSRGGVARGGRRRGSRRSSRTCWMGEGGPVAVGTTSGGDGAFGWLCARETEEGRSTRKSEGAVEAAWRREGGPGRRGEAASRRWPRRVCAHGGHTPSCPLAGG